ncbi:HipA N-terminal domain-containing protein [Sutterella sp.]|uniref:HipA N-terminal domain-containing protein n=1 Tax=Sutterella sp. TaxID=1981025 RepID=UPI0026E04EEB|nr:HipA N-terminal domain-containing protein [Sutterella sp.]MDO5532485.1 HipA N-terminal domain-containing protein [Sutterella sp.]
MTMTRRLSLWMNGHRAGMLAFPGRDRWELDLDDDRAGSGLGLPLSRSLPLTAGGSPLTGDAVRNFFLNLLPENEDLRRLTARDVPPGPDDLPALLLAGGRDCPGALQILAEDEEPAPPSPAGGTELTETEIAERLRLPPPSQTSDRLLEDDYRYLLPGAKLVE